MALQLIGYVLALLLGVLAIHFWRKTGSLYTLLVEGAGRYEDLRRQFGEIEEEVTQFRGRENSFTTRERALEAEVSEARRKAIEFSKQLDLRNEQEKVRLDKLELQKNHLEREIMKLRDANERYEEERASLKAATERVRLDSARHDQEKVAPLRERVTRLETDLRNAQREKQDLEKRLAGADPVETKKMKRKVAQYARLYSSMKGLREMTDERNRNWETALRKLSLWIVTKEAKGKRGGVALDLEKAPIGPLVGEAMSLIGEQLVNETDFDRHHHDEDHHDISLDHDDEGSANTASQDSGLADSQGELVAASDRV